MSIEKFKFIRGDTFSFKFQRKNLNDEPILVQAEKMWFTVKKNYKKTDKLIQKTLSDKTISFDEDGYYHIIIEHDDTKNLKYGDYVWDIQVENKGIVSTIKLGKLTLTDEVTFEGGK